MGAAESNPSAQSGTADPSFDQKTSGVRVTGAVANDVEDRIKQAYEKGKEDGTNSFQSSLEQVAAQVYENIHNQLQTIQNDSLEKSKSVAADVKSKITLPIAAAKPCADEESALLACMTSAEGSGDPLACKAMVNAYASCALSTTS